MVLNQVQHTFHFLLQMILDERIGL